MKFSRSLSFVVFNQITRFPYMLIVGGHSEYVPSHFTTLDCVHCFKLKVFKMKTIENQNNNEIL